MNSERFDVRVGLAKGPLWKRNISEKDTTALNRFFGVTGERLDKKWKSLKNSSSEKRKSLKADAETSEIIESLDDLSWTESKLLKLVNLTCGCKPAAKKMDCSANDVTTMKLAFKQQQGRLLNSLDIEGDFIWCARLGIDLKDNFKDLSGNDIVLAKRQYYTRDNNWNILPQPIISLPPTKEVSEIPPKLNDPSFTEKSIDDQLVQLRNFLGPHILSQQKIACRKSRQK